MSDHIHHQTRLSPEQGFWRGGGGLALLAAGIVGAMYLLFEHTAQVMQYLPLGLLLLCPLMHVFMHRGHGGHGGGSRSGTAR